MFEFLRRNNEIRYETISDFSQYRGNKCIIRRNGKELGIFSHYLTNAGNIASCIKNGLMPIIDMKNAENIWNEQENREVSNPWSFFFKQPFGVDINDVEKEKNTIIQNGILNESQRPGDSMEFLTNENAVAYWRGFVKQYLQYSEYALEYAKQKYIKLIPNKKILGVLCRGTDYINIQPMEHPIQPPIDEIVKKVKEIKEKWQYDEVYLASEDREICSTFRKEFGTKLIQSTDVKISYNSTDYINTVFEREKVDIYQNTLDYMASIFILSKCHGLVAGRTSGSVAAFIMSDGYEYSYFYNLGRYKCPNYKP